MAEKIDGSIRIGSMMSSAHGATEQSAEDGEDYDAEYYGLGKFINGLKELFTPIFSNPTYAELMGISMLTSAVIESDDKGDFSIFPENISGPAPIKGKTAAAFRENERISARDFPDGVCNEVIPDGVCSEVIPDGVCNEVIPDGVCNEVIPGGMCGEIIPCEISVLNESATERINPELPASNGLALFSDVPENPATAEKKMVFYDAATLAGLNITEHYQSIASAVKNIIPSASSYAPSARVTAAPTAERVILLKSDGVSQGAQTVKTDGLTTNIGRDLMVDGGLGR